MTARTFDPEKNQEEIRSLYGDAHADRQVEWDIILGRVGQDVRDTRDPKKLGQRILSNMKRRVARDA